MEYQTRYLRAKILYDHLNHISLDKSVSEETSLGLGFASSLTLLEPSPTSADEYPVVSLGGLNSYDIARYGPQHNKLSWQAKVALSEALKTTLHEVTLCYHGTEDADKNKLHYSLADDVENELSRMESDIHDTSMKVETLVYLYQQCTEAHSTLNDCVKSVIDALPSVANASHSASHEYLAMTIEASLLKLSVVRARLKSALYGYVSSSNTRISVADSVKQMHGRLMAQQTTLEREERETQGSLTEYQRIIELVDGKDGRFSQIVEDLTTVQRETEECRKDLRRLGWTEE